MYFNSIKVQLKPFFRQGYNMFQQFQFHKGTIKTVKLAVTAQTAFDFNSIKVQLKQQNEQQRKS